MKRVYELILLVFKDLIHCKNLIKSLTFKEKLEASKIILFGLLVNEIYGSISGNLIIFLLIIPTLYAIIKILQAERG